MDKLGESEELTYIQKLSSVSHIPVEYIQKFRDMGYMDETAARNSLIRSDYARLKKEGVTVKKRMEWLREAYNIEIRQLQNIVASIKRVYYCKYCGQKIMPYYVQKHDSVCPRCIANRKKL